MLRSRALFLLSSSTKIYPFSRKTAVRDAVKCSSFSHFLFARPLSTESHVPAPLKPPIVVTPRAVQRLKELLAKEANSGKALRVAVDPGGCQGFQYSFSLDHLNPDDRIVSVDGSPLVIVDNVSIALLKEVELDFIEELVYSGFKVTQNSSATTVCSCGSSFDVTN